MPKVIIDNPGGGDCGFYAFAVALIDIIQQQARAGDDQSKTLRQLQGLGADISLEDINAINLQALSQSPRPVLGSRERRILDTLQMSLRKVAANEYKQQLMDRMAIDAAQNQIAPGSSHDTMGSQIFGRFKHLVEEFLTGNLLRAGVMGSTVRNQPRLRQLAQFNELALDDGLLQAAAELANTVDAAIVDASIGNQTYGEITRAADPGCNLQIAEATLGTHLENYFTRNIATILPAIDAVARQGRWATDEDLRILAEVLEVNLKVAGQQTGVLPADQPTVELINQENAHWVTSVDIALPANQHRLWPAIFGTTQSTSTARAGLSSQQTVCSSSQEDNLTQKIAQIVTITASAAQPGDKRANYEQLLRDLVGAACELSGVFANISAQDRLTGELDTAEAKHDAAGIQTESDEEFAVRLQEAELANVGISLRR